MKPLSALHDTLELVESDIDLIFEGQTGRWFFRQYREEPLTGERDSTSFDSRAQATAAYPNDLIWEEWHTS